MFTESNEVTFLHCAVTRSYYNEKTSTDMVNVNRTELSNYAPSVFIGMMVISLGSYIYGAFCS